MTDGGQRKVTLVHKPRTGGITTTQHLIKCGMLDRKKNQRPATSLTAEERTRIIVGIIRDPLSWYPSVYNMSKIKSRTGLEFADWLRQFMREPHNHRTCCWGRIECPPCPSQVGAFSYYHILYFCDDPATVLEALQDSYVKRSMEAWKWAKTLYADCLMVNWWLRTWVLDEDLKQLTGSKPEKRLNVTESDPFLVSRWYDVDTENLVIESDEALMNFNRVWKPGIV